LVNFELAEIIYPISLETTVVQTIENEDYEKIQAEYCAYKEYIFYFDELVLMFKNPKYLPLGQLFAEESPKL
jgi:hypothetical protein